MKTRIFAIFVIAFGFCVLLWLRTRPNPNMDAVEDAAQTVPTVSTNAASKTGANEAKTQQSNSSSTNLPPVQQTVGMRVVAGIPVDQKLLSEWQAPIDFYGKVVDQDSNAVAGADIQFKWDETPLEGGEKSEATASDSTGLFSLHGVRGRVLQVWASKEGYYASSPGFRNFIYSMTEHFQPDSLNPVVFHLRKKGQSTNLIHVKQNYHVPRDGTPIAIDLESGKMSPGAAGDVVVRCQTEDQGKKSGQKYNWHCVITVPGGGIESTTEEFPFLAPEGNYLPSMEIVMPADRPDWKSDVDLQFYYRLANGNYGRVTFSMIAGGHHFCMIDSFLNPSGSQNLEPSN